MGEGGFFRPAMNRTLLASLVLILALLTLAIAWHGKEVGRQARNAGQEWEQLSAEVELKTAEAAQRAAAEKDRAARRLALTYRLKKVAGKRAQAEATGADQTTLRVFDDEILALETELRGLRSGD